MYFNTFHLELISSILHRSARITFPMVWRTSGFRCAKNDTNFECILAISRFATLQPLKMLFSPLVLATFSSWHQICIIFMIRHHFKFRRNVNVCTYFQCFFNVFMLPMFGVVFATLTRRQVTVRNMLRPRALVFTKCRCA